MDRKELVKKVQKCYEVMTGGEISNTAVLFDKVLAEFNQIYIENDIACDDLINTVITPDMTYNEIIEAIKDYFGYEK